MKASHMPCPKYETLTKPEFPNPTFSGTLKT
jgi:hypothetical protein